MLRRFYAVVAACVVVALLCVSNALAFINYNQPTGDSCCFTAMAIAVTNETGQHVTPADLLNQFSGDMTPGGASLSLDTDVAARYHLVIHNYSTKVGNLAAGFQDARRAIRMGGIAVIHFRAGYFTSAAHCVVLWKMAGGNFRMADPNRRGKHGDSERPQGWNEPFLERQGDAFMLSVII